MTSIEPQDTLLRRHFHLSSIKNRIVLFALVVTLIPTITMGWLSYRNNRKSIEEKVATELTHLAANANRELDLWFKERRYEVKVFASSYEVSENLDIVGKSADAVTARNRLEEYLRSVARRFSDYEDLLVVNLRGEVVASSSGAAGILELDAGWQESAHQGRAIINQPVWDRLHEEAVMVISEPIRTADERLLGLLAAKTNLDGIDRILRTFGTPDHEMDVLTEAGEVLVSSVLLNEGFLETRLAAATAGRLVSGQERMLPLEFRNARGREVVGLLVRIPSLGWSLVAQFDSQAAYGPIVELRRTTFSLVFLMVLGVGLAAYFLGLTIVRPLNRLAAAAARVAEGHLDFDLPVENRSEIGVMTKVFNDMVERLRSVREQKSTITKALHEKNQELRSLSITDGLTGLYNRTHLAEIISRETSRSERNDHIFSLLMVDIDHFKRFNDTHGHQAGDDVLRAAAGIFTSCIRECDHAARYGGEEFILVLAETGTEEAVVMADRIRRQIEETRFLEESVVTISVGVATYPDHGQDMDSLVREADAALYRAKRSGRNRVVAARGPRTGGAGRQVSDGPDAVHGGAQPVGTPESVA